MHIFQTKINQSIRVDENIYVPSETFQFAERLLERDFYRRPNGRHHRRHRRAAAGYRIRHRVGRLSRKRDYHGHHRRVRHLAAGRQQSTDRRPHRSLYRDRLRYHRPLRRNRTDRSDDHGRRDPGHARRLQAGHGHQIHPLPDRRRIHQRHRGYDLHHADQRPARTERGLRPGRFPTQMAVLFRKYRHGRPAFGRRRNRQHRHHRPMASHLEKNSRFAGRHLRNDASYLPAQTVRRSHLDRNDRRPFPDQRIRESPYPT